MPKEQSSEELSSLAARVLKMEDVGSLGSLVSAVDAYNRILAIAKRLAGSVLSQDETPEEADEPHPYGLDVSDLPGGTNDDRDD